MEIEKAIDKFNKRVNSVNEKKLNTKVRSDFFNSVNAQLKQTKSDISDIMSVMSVLTDRIKELEGTIKAIEFPDPTDKVLEGVAKSEQNVAVLFSDGIKDVKSKIPKPVDSSDKVIKAIKAIKMPVFPEIPKVRIPDIPEYPEPVKYWEFEVEKVDGKYKVKAWGDI